MSWEGERPGQGTQILGRGAAKAELLKAFPGSRALSPPPPNLDLASLGSQKRPPGLEVPEGENQEPSGVQARLLLQRAGPCSPDAGVLCPSLPPGSGRK